MNSLLSCFMKLTDIKSPSRNVVKKGIFLENNLLIIICVAKIIQKKKISWKDQLITFQLRHLGTDTD